MKQNKINEEQMKQNKINEEQMKLNKIKEELERHRRENRRESERQNKINEQQPKHKLNKVQEIQPNDNKLQNLKTQPNDTSTKTPQKKIKKTFKRIPGLCVPGKVGDMINKIQGPLSEMNKLIHLGEEEDNEDHEALKLRHSLDL
jgi:hypothetical protein